MVPGTSGTQDSSGFTIAIDVTPYLASRTGVGVCVGELVSALLASRGEDRLKLCAFSPRRGAFARLSQGFPDSEIRIRHLPVRFLSPLVDKNSWLTVETLFGHSDVFHAGPLLVPAGKKAAVVTTVYDLTPIRFPELHLPSNLFTIPQLRRRLERADLVMVPSSWTGKDLEDLGLAPPQKIRVIPLGVDDCYKPVEPKCRGELSKLGLDCDYILNVGALEPRKNLPRLFQAFRILKDRQPSAYKLAVVGPKGWKDDTVFESVRSLGLSDVITFTGYVSNEVLNLLYNHAALMVYPSLYEGFGLPPLEAMAAGCPVAVSNAGSLPEVVGDAGIYFDPTEVEQIADAMHRVLNSPELRARMVHSGQVQSSRFSWENTAAATRQVYTEACAIRRGAQQGF